MKFSILTTTIALLSPLWLIAPAKAYNPADLELLKQTNACIRCDLSGAPLSGLYLVGANLRESNLSRAVITQSNLAGVDFSGASLEAANLAGSNLAGASFTGANLRSASLVNTNLTAAGMIATDLIGANLRGARMNLVISRGARYGQTTLPSGVVTPIFVLGQ